MGLIWDMGETNRINENRNRTESLDDRMREPELRVGMQDRVIRSLLDHLERKFGEDLTGDGQIGLPDANASGHSRRCQASPAG